VSTVPGPEVGELWTIDVHGCDADALRDRTVLATLFDTLVARLGLHPMAPAQWHAFPHPGGVTGALILGESHLSVHTFPEHRSACLDLFTCVPRVGAGDVLCLVVSEQLCATDIRVTRHTRQIAGVSVSVA
jgi:S-adenosylmethionine decarboxylase